MTAKATPDWEAIERAYRTGLLSAREIGIVHGVSHTAINKRAKSFNWSRDLKAKVQARADALVSKAEVSRLVSKETVITEKIEVESAATALADIKLSQRRNIGRCLELANTLLEELSSSTDMRGDIADLIKQLKEQADDSADALELASRMSSFPRRMKSMKELSEIMKTLIALQRQAYGIDESSHEEPYEDRLARVMAGQ
ncbi:hypothetical protein P4A93_12295 [Pseudomonas syringae pv. syringae]|uniref:hypothetical protein n=1 Tax=Pseudomonas syringae TaxID=317 RepID=UPI0023F6C8C8|nr:hypothetical protein [Pseudomonas syringae]MDF5892407.1 hypothetical protein [Pseudomonas syringae pv. syringae]